MDVEVLSESHFNVISFVRVFPRGGLDNDVHTFILGSIYRLKCKFSYLVQRGKTG